MTVSFCFATVAELTPVVRYMATYDDTVRFALTRHDEGNCTLRVTSARVPSLCYAEAVYESCVVAPCADCSVAAHTSPFATASSSSLLSLSSRKVCWAVDARTLIRVLATFDAQHALVLEACDGGAAVLLYQQTSTASTSTSPLCATRVARLDVLHDVSPELLVSHHVDQFYRIRDVHSFRRACLAAACNIEDTAATATSALVADDIDDGNSSNRRHDDDNDDGEEDGALDSVVEADAAAQCCMTLCRRRSGVCELLCETAVVKALVRLCEAAVDDANVHSRNDKGGSGDDADKDGGDNEEVERLCGVLRCADLLAFALLCRPLVPAAATSSSPSSKYVARATNSGAHVCIGFGDDGVALLRLQWRTCSGARTASLYFCRVATD